VLAQTTLAKNRFGNQALRYRFVRSRSAPPIRRRLVECVCFFARLSILSTQSSHLTNGVSAIHTGHASRVLIKVSTDTLSSKNIINCMARWHFRSSHLAAQPYFHCHCHHCEPYCPMRPRCDPSYHHSSTQPSSSPFWPT